MNNLQKIVEALSLVSKRVGHLMPGQAIVMLPNRSVVVIPLEEEGEDAIEAPSTPEPPAPQKAAPASVVKEIPPFHRPFIVQLVQVLLRKEVLPVGRTIRALTDDLSFKRSKVENLVRMGVDALPFLMKNGSLAPIRVRPGTERDAEEWVRHFSAVTESRVSTGMTDANFFGIASKVVYSLLRYPKGANSTLLVQETGVPGQTLRRFRQHMNTKRLLPFIRVEDPPYRGSPAVFTISDFPAAERWLSEQTKPAAQAS